MPGAPTQAASERQTADFDRRGIRPRGRTVRSASAALATAAADVKQARRGPPLAKRIDEGPCRRIKKWHGVNYGNRFIPEDWMTHPYPFFKSVQRSKGISRVALWDLEAGSGGAEPKRRMMDWLEETISESHFRDMAKFGVEVVRVPCGYWNWVAYSGNDGPVAPRSKAGVPMAKRLRNLHRIAEPHEYHVHFDRIFEYAAKYNIKVLLDLHGLPGSQNGEIHSGACFERDDYENRTTYFEAEANKDMAVQAIREMARYASHEKRKKSLFGIQVINEPHLQSEDKGHSFLRRYYTEAILAAREFLEPSVPVVLFEWTYNMENWEENAFPESTYGTILWDTHIYHFPKEGEQWTSKGGGLWKAMKAYRWDLSQLRYFSGMQGGRVIVGEFSLAGPSLNKQDTKLLLQWLVDQFDFAAAGSLVWTFDGSNAAWSMRKSSRAWGINWKRVTSAARHDTEEGPMIMLKSAHGGASSWLSAFEDGGVGVVSTEADWWEQWIPHRYRVGGQLRLALRSVAHGTWLSVTDEGHITQADERSLWEEFCVVPFGDKGSLQRIALVSAHGTWLTKQPDANSVAAVSKKPGGGRKLRRSLLSQWLVA